MISIKVTLPAIGEVAWQNVMPRFVSDAGTLILDAVRDELGSASIYTLSDPYRKRKLAGKTTPAMRRFAGKAADQPLILTGEHIYNWLSARPEGNSLVVEVDPSHGFADGFDVAEHWEDVAHYLERGLARVEDRLPGMLLDIIFQEMNL